MCIYVLIFDYFLLDMNRKIRPNQIKDCFRLLIPDFISEEKEEKNERKEKKEKEIKEKKEEKKKRKEREEIERRKEEKERNKS